MRLAAVLIDTASVNTTIYTVPTGKTTTCTLNLCNQKTSQAKVKIAISDTASPTTAEWIDFNHVLFPEENYQRSGLVLGSGQYIVVYSDSDTISANVWGFEE